ncbi:MAG: ROK family transcriptional regulator [Janthinobacterium lividum]
MTDTSDQATTVPSTLRGRSSAETRSAVLDLIRASGKISRVDLARRSALTEATISKIVKGLLAAGLIVPAGYAESTGGKRPVLLKLNNGGRYAVGLTMDFHSSTIVLCGPDGTELARSTAAGTGLEDPVVVLDRLAGDIEALMAREGVEPAAVIGLGVASPGRRAFPQGWNVDASFFDVWEPYSVEHELALRTGLAAVRENDANCAALGEFWVSQEPHRDFVAVYMSHGIGAGIVIDGAIYQGVSGNAGEIGHMVSVPDGEPCWCGSRGCLETVASPRAMVDQVLADPQLRAAVGVDEQTPIAEVFRRLTSGVGRTDEGVLHVLETAAGHFASAIGGLVNTLDLDLVVLAGPGFAGVGDVFVKAAQERVDSTAFMREVHPITVRLASVGSETAAFGAASVVLQRHLTPHRTAPV